MTRPEKDGPPIPIETTATATHRNRPPADPEETVRAAAQEKTFVWPRKVLSNCSGSGSPDYAFSRVLVRAAACDEGEVLTDP
ncbi:hypothetical protein NDU88_001574 [Pleurodeles waltl]|uniref:Uncharacterized protein n=1 Tax=Pleurodeles waltl TaxID=8319 RepID=A0AAV7KT94_PLEWA|nr:hypothetical protein NDU88_001574 [Pleurodeles waltl]